MIKMQSQVDQVIKAQERSADGRTVIPEESANVAVPRGVTVHIQGLLGKLNHLLHSYQNKGGMPAEQSQSSSAVQVSDLPGI